MADQETHREEEVAATESAEESTVTVAKIPEAAEPHTMAEIDEENLHSPDEVVQLDQVPPPDQADDMPADLDELREAAPTHQEAAEIREEKKLGPLTGSMWFLAISVAAFILSILVRLI